MSNNIWRDFAKLNNMTQEEFFSEMVYTTMAMMSLKLDKADSDKDAVQITKGRYTLVLVDNEKT